MTARSPLTIVPTIVRCEPRGKHVITVCMGTACHVRAADRLLTAAEAHLGLEGDEGTTKDGLFTLERVNCLGACALGPVVVLDGVYHHHVNPARLRALIESVRKGEKGGRSDG